MNNKKKLLFFVTEDWFFFSHFFERAIAAKQEGYLVFVVTQISKYKEHVEKHGIQILPIKIERSGTNVFKELLVLAKIIRLYCQVRPDIVHQVAFKPIIYGTIAAIICKVKYIVNAPVGMGYVFISKDKKARILKTLIQFALKLLWKRKNSNVVVENNDDYTMLIDDGFVNRNNIRLIRGAGVDINKFTPPAVSSQQTKQIILPARMLWDKGIGEFVIAAKILKRKYPDVEFVLIGGLDPENPNSISKEQLEKWVKEGNIEWWGYHEDMPEIFRNSYLVCLPSYREGLPKSLVEAAASGKAIITTDVPGCREVVINNINGLLVPVKNPQQLSNTLEKLITDPILTEKMGIESRKIAEKEFSSEKVISETLSLYVDLMV